MSADATVRQSQIASGKSCGGSLRTRQVWYSTYRLNGATSRCVAFQGLVQLHGSLVGVVVEVSPSGRRHHPVPVAFSLYRTVDAWSGNTSRRRSGPGSRGSSRPSSRTRSGAWSAAASGDELVESFAGDRARRRNELESFTRQRRRHRARCDRPGPAWRAARPSARRGSATSNSTCTERSSLRRYGISAVMVPAGLRAGMTPPETGITSSPKRTFTRRAPPPGGRCRRRCLVGCRGPSST